MQKDPPISKQKNNFKRNLYGRVENTIFLVSFDLVEFCTSAMALTKLELLDHVCKFFVNYMSGCAKPPMSWIRILKNRGCQCTHDINDDFAPANANKGTMERR